MKRDKDRYMVGLDVGTTGVKAGVVDAAGAVAGAATCEYDTQTPRPGWAEQEPSEWWLASCAALREAISASGVAPGAVSGIGVSGQMHGSVFLDQDSAVIRPCMLWCDQRTASQCDSITEEVGSANLADWVGNPALPGFTAPKVLWLRENEPGAFERVRHLMLPKDYVNMRLTGVTGTDVSDASGTLLFDVSRRVWSEPMLEKLRIPAEWLPEARESGERLGTVTSGAAQETGLASGTPVAAGGADNACSALGMGVVSPGEAAVSIGSSGTVLAPTASPLTDPEMRLHSFCHAVPGTWYLMGVTLSAGLSLRWFRDHLGEPELSAACRDEVDAYELLSRTASGAPAGCDGLVFLPYLSGERTPHADPHARGVLFGLDLTKTRAHVIRSIMEGVTFALNDSMKLMTGFGLQLSGVVSGGGGSRSSLWRQMQADVFEMPVTAAATGDAAMLGAAMLGGVAGGLFNSAIEACRRVVARGERLQPDRRSLEAYRGSYSLFRALYPALKPLYRES